MKLLLTIALSIFSMNATAAYQCVVNGKTIYSNSMCAQDAQQFSVDKDSDWTMKLKVRTAPKEDSRLNAVNSLPPSAKPAEAQASQAAAATTQANTEKPSKNSKFNCDGRDQCSQMTSCEEATLFLENCPNQYTDGDNDGIPCEIQWCR
ncbi:excalibur calcium-binding domain-containing protein [Methylobacter sp. YRD-M1]|uniref:excalibur calcium-binding domain-containing protein n=1 Tax=Methylobacter sp. YRD-M1 TaxID=2911520 RepID=UPI00227CC574|nr:excalibur calcium-binding domain-containing protein [Methylobacter sp. YRD-M1]WAK00436.1 excalibur calcium-binding domain-containing protein [Methylobacter sp. YRD-M1]